jgi:DNA replication protein DnaC
MDGFSKALLDIADKTEPNKAPEDYEKDGLLYCGKCNTPKQVAVPLCGKISKPYCMCKCETEAYNAEQARKREIFRKEEIERNRASGFLDLDMLNCRFEVDDRKNPKISDISQRYVEHFLTMRKKGKGLIYLGNSGTGKSFMAACIANALIDKGFKCLMTNFPRIINELTCIFEGKQAYIDSLNRYDLLIIDDLAVERDSEYTAEIIQNVIDSRYRSGKPLIITTNLTKSEYENPKNIKRERLFSRLYEMCFPLAVAGQDRRREKAAVKDGEMKDLLGI